MKKKLNSTFIASLQRLFILTVVGIILLNQAAAQIPAKDSAEIIKAMNDVSARIEAVLKADKTLYAEMSDAMKKINAIKDTGVLDNALTAYKTKYFTQYGAIVKKAGVDMNKIAADMHTRFPYITFSVNNLYALEYERNYKPLTYEFKETTTSTTTTTTLTAFTKNQDEQCGAVSGSYVKFDGRNIHAWAGALVAGGCTGWGSLVKIEILPSDAKSIVLKLNYTLRSKNYAISVGGLAISASNGFTVIKVAQTTLQDDLVRKDAIAPVFWYARSNKESDFTKSIDLTEYKGKLLTVYGQAWATAVSVGLSNTESDGYCKITKADLIVTK